MKVIFSRNSGRQHTQHLSGKYSHLLQPENDACDDDSTLSPEEQATIQLESWARYSEIILEGMSLRQKKNWIEESCNLRLGPDGFGLNKKERKLVLLEFHQSYGQGIRLREKQKSRKTRRELPVLSFFNSLTSSHQRKMSQLNFTVGVRGSISTNHPRLLSFASSLESLEKLGLSSSLRPN